MPSDKVLGGSWFRIKGKEWKDDLSHPKIVPEPTIQLGWPAEFRPEFRVLLAHRMHETFAYRQAQIQYRNVYSLWGFHRGK